MNDLQQRSIENPSAELPETSTAFEVVCLTLTPMFHQQNE